MAGGPEQAWLEELYELLRIPSVSADPAHADDVRRAGEWVCDFVRAAGGEAGLVETSTFPLAIGEIPASSGNGDAPTVMLYGHFDVQPPAPLDLWDSDPFEPEIRDGYLYARGSVDDKGNSYLLLKAAELLAREGELPVNVRIAFDGEEETGGHSIVEFLEADERGADACIIFDSGMPREDVPSFDLGTRGLIYFHVRLSSGERDLHSGMFGGAALNAVHALMQTLEAVVAVPDELRAGVAPATEEERRSWQELDPGADVLAARGRASDGRRGGRGLLPSHAGRPRRGRERPRRRLADPAEDRASGGRRGERLHPARAWPGRRRDRRSLRAAPPRGGARRRRARDRALVVCSRRAHLSRGAAPSSWRRTRSRTRSESARSCSEPAAPCRSCPRWPTRASRRSSPASRSPAPTSTRPNERLLARYIPLGVAAARETLLAFKEL